MKKRRKRKRRIRVIPLLVITVLLIVAGLGMMFGVRYFSEHYQKKEADTTSGWNLILVNEENLVPSDWNVTLITLDNGQQVDERIYPALQAMFDEARNSGLQLYVRSGYRSEAEQQNVYDSYVQQRIDEGYSLQEAESYASGFVSLPNTSEHQLGIAVDINADGDTMDEEVYAWLDANAYLYGFIQRYPSDKTDITGINNEPWHYRYVGKEAASYMHENNLCLEEYIEQLKQ